ncbi:MAG TPA: S4 domain-containing protein, partial [Blastocatellia bacterium]|nr:S4 domain-containing protein [Blastocatellia bacterium]
GILTGIMLSIGRAVSETAAVIFTMGSSLRLPTSIFDSERHPRDLKADLARRIVADFHTPGEAEKANREFDRMFREHQTPAEIPTIEKPAAGIKLVKLLAAEGLAPSVSEAQRLITQGGVRLNGERVNDLKLEVGFQPGDDALIQVGSRKFLRVVFI